MGTSASTAETVVASFMPFFSRRAFVFSAIMGRTTSTVPVAKAVTIARRASLITSEYLKGVALAASIGRAKKASMSQAAR